MEFGHIMTKLIEASKPALDGEMKSNTAFEVLTMLMESAAKKPAQEVKKQMTDHGPPSLIDIIENGMPSLTEEEKKSGAEICAMILQNSAYKYAAEKSGPPKPAKEKEDCSSNDMPNLVDTSEPASEVILTPEQVLKILKVCGLLDIEARHGETIIQVLSMRSQSFEGFKDPEEAKGFLNVVLPGILPMKRQSLAQILAIVC